MAPPTKLHMALLAVLFIISLGFYITWMKIADIEPDKQVAEIFLMVVIGLLFIASVVLFFTEKNLNTVPFIFCGYALMSLVALDRNVQIPPEKKKAIQYRTFSYMFGYMTILPYILHQVSGCMTSNKLGDTPA